MPSGQRPSWQQQARLAYPGDAVASLLPGFVPRFMPQQQLGRPGSANTADRQYQVRRPHGPCVLPVHLSVAGQLAAALHQKQPGRLCRCQAATCAQLQAQRLGPVLPLHTMHAPAGALPPGQQVCSIRQSKAVCMTSAHALLMPLAGARAAGAPASASPSGAPAAADIGPDTCAQGPQSTHHPAFAGLRMPLLFLIEHRATAELMLW